MTDEAEGAGPCDELRSCLSELVALRAGPPHGAEFKKWWRRVRAALWERFGEDHHLSKEFVAISFEPDRRIVSLGIGSGEQGWKQRDRNMSAFRCGLDSVEALLAEAISVLGRNPGGVPRQAGQLAERSALTTVVRLCERFHRVTTQLQHRHNSRRGFPVKDEYDVQDLFHALLRLFFDDVRPEEYTPSNAGACARMDFLLKDHAIAVEVKMTRKGLAAKEVGDQLIVDIQRYQAHSSCKTLVCFVYDPAGLVANPAGLEKDLSRRHGDISVQVIVRPNLH